MYQSPNVSPACLAILFRIEKVPDSNLGSESGCLNLVFVGFFQLLQADSGIISETRQRPLPSVSIQIYYSLIIISSDAMIY
jgi:hypothetical protein